MGVNFYRDQFPPTVSQAQYEATISELRVVSTTDVIVNVVASDQDLKV